MNQCESENNSFSIDVDLLQEKIVDRLKFGRLWHGEERPIHILSICTYIYIYILISWLSLGSLNRIATVALQDHWVQDFFPDYSNSMDCSNLELNAAELASILTGPHRPKNTSVSGWWMFQVVEWDAEATLESRLPLVSNIKLFLCLFVCVFWMSLFHWTSGHLKKVREGAVAACATRLLGKGW